MARYAFRLVLAAVSELTQDLEDAVFEAGCDDALLGISHGQACLHFDREADSLTTAVQSALNAARNAGLSVLTVETEPQAWEAAAPS